MVKKFTKNDKLKLKQACDSLNLFDICPYEKIHVKVPTCFNDPTLHKNGFEESTSVEYNDDHLWLTFYNNKKTFTFKHLWDIKRCITEESEFRIIWDTITDDALLIVFDID